jgi:hypothetical protein
MSGCQATYSVPLSQFLGPEF